MREAQPSEAVESTVLRTQRTGYTALSVQHTSSRSCISVHISRVIRAQMPGEQNDMTASTVGQARSSLLKDSA